MSPHANTETPSEVIPKSLKTLGATIPKSQYWRPLPSPFNLSSTTLPTKTYTVDSAGFPCRRCLQDGRPGDEMLLVSYDPFLGDSPYRNATPIFLHVHPPCQLADSLTGGSAMPEQQHSRLLSVRAFDRGHMMKTAEVVEGARLNEVTERFLAGEEIEYLHVHNARQGCFAVRIERA